MNETELYEAKEECKNNLQDFLRQYFEAAEEYGLDTNEHALEITDLLFDCGKKWDIVTD